MRQRNWKAVRANSLVDAMHLCTQHAQLKLNRSVDNIADLMGLSSVSTLYKWMSTGRLPAVMIRPFESACGIDLVTQYTVSSAGKLIIDIPTGRSAKQLSTSELQVTVSATVMAIVSFYENGGSPEDALAKISQSISGLAWHRENLMKAAHPELDFGGKL